MKLFQKMKTGRLIALGFFSVIFLGSILLIMPFSLKNGMHMRYIDALYTSTSAVCVTGLVVVDTGDSFTAIGQAIICLLIQIGGLGVASVRAGIILIMGKRINLKDRTIIREAMNLNTGKGLIRFVKSILLTTLIFELIGAALSFVVFSRDYPPLRALGISVFHSVASFNNAGFDIIGNFQSLIPYQNNVLLNLVTCGLIVFGGIGFLVINDLWDRRLRWRKLSMHSRVVISVSAFLIVSGTLLIKLSEDVTWLGAVFNSISARTAGFSTYSIGSFTTPGLLVLAVLMFIGASSGSTGGGIKTSTLFVLFQGIKTAATNRGGKAFHYNIPNELFRKASVISILAASVVFMATYLLSLLEPGQHLMDLFFEMTSAFGTVGLTTGITPGLCDASKLLSMIVMYIGRLGPLTVVSLWYFTLGEHARFPNGNIAIG